MTDQKQISLAQWCAYLPYGLKVLINDKEYRLDMYDMPFVAVDINKAIDLNAKPLLRPMNEDINVSAVMQVYRNAYNCKDLVWNSELKLFVFQIDGARLSIYSIPHDVVEAFLAAHYDIFNLIPQGLALPIE